MLCVGEKLDKSSSVLMGFFLPPIHLSQQLSFILISFYLNLQNCARDEKEVERLNNHAPCGAGDLEAQSHGEGGSGSPGVLAAGTIPRSQAANSLEMISCGRAGTPPHQQPWEEP